MVHWLLPFISRPQGHSRSSLPQLCGERSTDVRVWAPGQPFFSSPATVDRWLPLCVLPAATGPVTPMPRTVHAGPSRLPPRPVYSNVQHIGAEPLEKDALVSRAPPPCGQVWTLRPREPYLLPGGTAHTLVGRKGPAGLGRQGQGAASGPQWVPPTFTSSSLGSQETHPAKNWGEGYVRPNQVGLGTGPLCVHQPGEPCVLARVPGGWPRCQPWPVLLCC